MNKTPLCITHIFWPLYVILEANVVSILRERRNEWMWMVDQHTDEMNII